MNKYSAKPKVLVIVGPTASGKTSLSITLATQFHGEIISADSRQVYRGLDIGTGKVTTSEMCGIPHHLLDVANPQDVYTVADYVRDGQNAIAEISERNALPIIVGGTFFYIDALLGKISAPDVAPNKKLRADLELKSNDELYAMLKNVDAVRAETIDADNKRRLVRALEISETFGSVPQTQSSEHYEAFTIGISISKDALINNIHVRLMSRLNEGMIEEVENLLKNGLPHERLHELGIEYRYIAEHLQGKITTEEMCEFIKTKSWQYAKRQMTWLKRNETIQWFELNKVEKIEEAVQRFLE